MPSFTEFADQERSRFEAELFDFVRIPSISTLPDHRPDITRAAEFAKHQLLQAGLESVEVIEGNGHPLVYGEWLGAPGKPTILFYGHYDVQPVDPLEEWISPPFEPTVRDGQVYARGASDDKGQVLANIKALEALRRSRGSLPVNVKFLIEGEEEVGGETIAAYVATHKEQLAADAAFVSDTAMYMPETPTICTGLRGMTYTEWIAHGAERDLHSGLYGGVAPNAVFGLVELLAKCKDATGRVLIPGFYDDVDDPAADEKASWDRIPFDEDAYRRTEVGASTLTGEPGFSVFERVGARPTFEVHGIPGGFMGPGAKTVIPATATAKVSARLVPRQDPYKILQLMRDFAANNAPPFDEDAYRRTEVGASTLTGEPGFSVFERVGARPTFEVHGIPGGFMGPGAKTVIPATATAKVSARLVPRQDPYKILQLMRDFAANNAPAGVAVDVRPIHTAPATLAATDHPVIKTAAQALKEVWGRETVFIRSGGSIPVVGDFQAHLGIPTALMGYGLPDDALHAPNEKFSLHNFHMGIASTARFLELLGERPAS